MFELVYPPESPCGCGSNREFGMCCLKDGKIVLSHKTISPPLPGTGRAHKKCVLGWTNDCCEKISGDHFVSEAVLKVLKQKQIVLSTRNFSRTHSLGSSSLKVNRLCRRHNSALSTIDSEAARFFAAFARIDESLSGGSVSQRLYFFHGLDLERWLLKTLIMVYFARLTNITPQTFRLPGHAPRLFQYSLAHPLGLYFHAPVDKDGNSAFVRQNKVSVRLHTLGDLVAGATVELGGLALTLVIHGSEGLVPLSPTEYTYRPKAFLFFKGQAVYCITTVFDEGSGLDVWISHGDPTAPIPTSVAD